MQEIDPNAVQADYQSEGTDRIIRCIKMQDDEFGISWWMAPKDRPDEVFLVTRTLPELTFRIYRKGHVKPFAFALSPSTAAYYVVCDLEVRGIRAA